MHKTIPGKRLVIASLFFFLFVRPTIRCSLFSLVRQSAIFYPEDERKEGKKDGKKDRKEAREKYSMSELEMEKGRRREGRLGDSSHFAHLLILPVNPYSLAPFLFLFLFLLSLFPASSLSFKKPTPLCHHA